MPGQESSHCDVAKEAGCVQLRAPRGCSRLMRLHFYLLYLIVFERALYSYHCYPFMSGAPVYACNDGVYTTGNGIRRLASAGLPSELARQQTGLSETEGTPSQDFDSYWRVQEREEKQLAKTLSKAEALLKTTSPEADLSKTKAPEDPESTTNNKVDMPIPKPAVSVPPQEPEGTQQEPQDTKKPQEQKEPQQMQQTETKEPEATATAATVGMPNQSQPEKPATAPATAAHKPCNSGQGQGNDLETQPNSKGDATVANTQEAEGKEPQAPNNGEESEAESIPVGYSPSAKTTSTSKFDKYYHQCLPKFRCMS